METLHTQTGNYENVINLMGYYMDVCSRQFRQWHPATEDILFSLVSLAILLNFSSV